MKLIKAAALATLMAPATLASAETTLILGEAGPNRGARANALSWFTEQATDLSGGDLQFDIQWGGALFKAGAALNGIADGVADLGTVISVYFPQEMVAYGIADLPLQNDDAWVGMKATDELMRTNASIQANLADMNLVYIGTFTTSAVHIGCKGGAIRSVADIEGKKVRGVGAYGDTFKDLGANMVPMSVYDAYQGLDSGLLDCSQGYSYATAALKQHEVIDSYTLLNWGQVGALGILMNKDMFDSLSEANQTALLTAGEGMADELGRLITADNDRAIETMKAAGVEIITLPDADRETLVKGGQPYVDTWVERANAVGLDGAAMLDDYAALLAKYAKERDEQGYPWTR
ncbi:C4-dicarboxylate TRAP transporter substrate-binding protein [Tropicibacter naphthalenivorans]|uniref:Extracytoplasmic solute receptor protein YiaO n=1 Tax=Tropicibacter naphthalenivorans TaxID=441103 RepID=A0A0P1GII8_9RHOB|nr:C4-dicarboxylate TRAP transporter substrate-binding protein [Tropicibacter naphthalenivorans]CUH81662.1 Extracytoplasmic solute receptor protein YiaO [Tropicibacter naphthalenivorans]SMC99407.1 TRAP-type C4-dicarboxylate transport system, substrate-binding protein [Tropicibacter naphthalenivorans]